MKVEVEREEDGRWIAEVVEVPGAMAYGATRDEAVSRVEALILRVLADRICDEFLPRPAGIHGRGMSQSGSCKSRVLLRALNRIGWTLKHDA